MRVLLLFSVLLVACANLALAQAPNAVDAKKTAMNKLEKMNGQWKGTGWIQQGPKRESFTGGETVQKKLDGLAMLVEGNFTNAEGKVIHQTLAVLNCNEAMTGYDFATYLANGRTGVHDFKSVGDHFEWGFQIPNVGTVRYTIKIDETTWFEVGEFSGDGKTWMQNFEMKLTRVK